MVATARRSRGVFYPATDDTGEHELQRFIMELLRPLLARFLAARGVHAHVGADTFLDYEEGNPLKRYAPDVYVLPGVDQAVAVPCWKLWEIPSPPSFLLEVVGEDVGKDYDDVPAVAAVIGARELVLFDPYATPASTRRVRWQVYRRVARRGLVRVEVAHGDRVACRALGCWLRVVGEGKDQRLRVATGPRGDELVPTGDERAAAEAELARLRAAAARARPRRKPAR